MAFLTEDEKNKMFQGGYKLKGTQLDSYLSNTAYNPYEERLKNERKAPVPGVDYTPFSEFPKDKKPSLLERIREVFISSRGFEEEIKQRDEEILKENEEILARGELPKFRFGEEMSVKTNTKWLAEQAGGILSLGNFVSEKLGHLVGGEASDRYFENMRGTEQDYSGRLASSLLDYAKPENVEEAIAMRETDILTLIPGVTKSVASGLVRTTEKIGVKKFLAREGLEVADETAEAIAKSTSEKEIWKLMKDAVPTTKKPSYYNKPISEIEDAGEALARKAEDEIEDSVPPVSAQAFDDLGEEFLEKARVSVTPPKRESLIERASKAIEEAPTKVSEMFTSRYSYVGKLQKDMLKNAGIEVPKSDYKTVQKEFENLVSAERAARAKVDDFKKNVIDKVTQSGNKQAFDEYMFIRRAKSRVESGVKTGDWTVESSVAALEKLRKNIGTEAFSDIEKLAVKYQEYADDILVRLNRGGYITDDGLRAIRESNDFYAPYKMMKHIAEDVPNTPTKVRNFSKNDIIRVMEGTDDKELVIADMLDGLADKIYKTDLIIAENNARKSLASLADIEGSAVKKIRTTENVSRRIELASEIKEARKNVSALDRLISTREKWEKKLRKEINDLNIEGLKEFFNKETKIPRKKKVSSLKKGAELTSAETVKFINELINLSPSKLRNIKGKIDTRDKRLGSVIDEIIEAKKGVNEWKQKIAVAKGEVADLSDIERAAASEGKGIVTFVDNGITNVIELPIEVANAVKGLNVKQIGVVSNGLKYALIPARASLTTLNVAFQAKNILIDTARTALISKYRVQNIPDVVRFGSDVVFSLVESIGGNFDDLVRTITKGNVSTMSGEYKEAKDLGVFSGTLSDYVKDFSKKYKPEPTKAQNVVSGTIDIFDNFASSLEEVSKLVAYKRAKRFAGKTADEMSQKEISDMLYEIRNYAGSPDFYRGGTVTPAANTLFMFFNARVQGVSQDLARLSGYSDGGKEAAKAWAAMSSLVGLPVLMTSIMNNTKYKEDYKKLQDWEKDDYIVIFKDSYKKNKDGDYLLDGEGNPIRDAFKIPVRDSLGAFKNMVETTISAAMDDSEDIKDKAVNFLVDTVEGFSPINIEGETIGERLEAVASSTNPLIKSVIEFYSGRDLYRHKDVIPEYLTVGDYQYLPNSFRKKDTTPSWAIRIGELTDSSPLIVEKVANNFGANIFLQFKSREDGTNVLTKPFTRSPYYKDNEAVINELEGANEERAIKKIEAYSKARIVYELISDKSKEEQTAILMEMNNRGELDEDMMKEMNTFKLQDKYGYSQVDIMLKDLGVEDGTRAIEIYKIVSTMGKKEQSDYLNKLAEKKILTKNVLEQLVYIKQAKGKGGGN